MGPKQKQLYNQLVDFDEHIGKELAGIYEGAIRAISNTSNPDRFAQTAHSCREVMTVFKIKVFRRSGYGINKQDVESILKGMDPLKNPPKEVIEKLQRSWPKLHDYFSAIAHHEKKPTSKEFAKNFEKMEDIFLILTKPSIQIINEIDFLLQEKPTTSAVNQAIKMLKNAVLANYFFVNVPISWLNILEDSNAFSNPPLPIIEEDTPRSPPWPQTRFLLRAAGEKSSKVMKIIENCNLSSDPKRLNITILIDFAEIALNMPGKTSKRIVSLIEKQRWLYCPYVIDSLLSFKLCELLGKLSKETELETAFRLANVLLDITISKPTRNAESIMCKAHPLIEARQYQKILDENLPLLLRKDPLNVIEIVANKLNKIIYLENKAKGKKKQPTDLSLIWRPAIENNVQNWTPQDPKLYLLISLRNSLENIGKRSKSTLKDGLGILDNYKYPVFTRIKLHIYRMFPQSFKKEIRKSIPEYFYEPNCYHEYQLLIEKVFPSLDQKLKNWYLQQVDKGPKERKDRKKVERWKLKRLQNIEKYLSGKWKGVYNELIQKYGKIKLSKFLTFRTSFVGPASPLTIDELEQLLLDKGIIALLKYLLEWIPPESIYGEPSIEGLGRILEELVEKYPEEFSNAALLFDNERVRPVYIYHLFSGLEKAIRDNRKINWDPVIDIAMRISLANSLPDFEDLREELEPSWNYVLSAILSLFRKGFISIFLMPFNRRNDIWKVIAKLSNHEEPTVTYENKYSGENLDPVTISINTVRGQAIHAVIDYAIWSSNNLGKRTIVKEAKCVLEKHLDIAYEPTLTIRAVYGLRLLNLIYLDSKWCKKNINRIFPKYDKLIDFWVTAFESFLANPVDRKSFNILKNEYQKGIDYLRKKRRKKVFFVDINKRLPGHLMVAYALGFVKKDMIDYFFENANIEVRSISLNILGQVVLNNRFLDENRNNLRLNRIKSIINERIANNDKLEIENFGSIFLNSPFRKSDNIANLHKVLMSTVGIISSAREVIDKLIEYTKINPLLVIKCLCLITQRLKGWEIHYKRETYDQIIRELLIQKNKKVKKEAIKLINKLVEKGFLEFNELMAHVRINDKK